MTDITDQFYYGVILGVLLIFFFWAYSTINYARLLVTKSENKTAIMIAGKFYYIVPAIEYNRNIRGNNWTEIDD